MTDELEQLLKNLKLGRLRAVYDEQLRAAEKQQLSYSEFVAGLLRTQWHDRQESALEWRIRRANPRTINKRVLESLAAAGAFDTFEQNRARAHAAVDAVLDGRRMGVVCRHRAWADRQLAALVVASGRAQRRFRRKRSRYAANSSPASRSSTAMALFRASACFAGATTRKTSSYSGTVSMPGPP